MLGFVRLNGMAESRKVRVSYVPSGFGLALTITESPDLADDAALDRPPADGSEGVLRVSDACVTLELPMADGRRPMLAWDPAEFNWEALVS